METAANAFGPNAMGKLFCNMLLFVKTLPRRCSNSNWDRFTEVLFAKDCDVGVGDVGGGDVGGGDGGDCKEDGLEMGD